MLRLKILLASELGLRSSGSLTDWLSICISRPLRRLCLREPRCVGTIVMARLITDAAIQGIKFCNVPNFERPVCDRCVFLNPLRFHAFRDANDAALHIPAYEHLCWSFAEALGYLADNSILKQCGSSIRVLKSSGAFRREALATVRIPRTKR